MNEHILNVQAICKRIAKNRMPNLYQRVNTLFKGASFMATADLVKEIRSIVRKEHDASMKFLDKMEKELTDKSGKIL